MLIRVSSQDSVFHDFLLAKIINAERACFRAPKFAELQVGQKLRA